MGLSKRDQVELAVAELLDDIAKHGPDGFAMESPDERGPETSMRMSEQEIVDLKEELREDPELIFQVCAALVLHRLNVYEASSPDKPIFASREDYAFEAMAQKDELTELLNQALALPDHEWPAFIVNHDGAQIQARPEEFKETLNAMQVPPESEEDQRG